MKIVAIDFETANTSPVSAISLGYAIYEDGEFLDSDVIYFCPPRNYDRFIFTYIHHLTYEDVKDYPYFNYYYDRLKEVFDGAMLVAHNTGFDINVLNSLCDYYDLEHFHNTYIDTVKISRIVYPSLVNHKLNTVCDALDIDLDHHEALSDAMGCLMILIRAMEDLGTFGIEEFLEEIYLKPTYNK